jgi:hypothetical protein
MRFTRHARNEMRLYKLTEADAKRVLANPIAIQIDPDGRRMYVGMAGGRRVRLILAGDDPELVVTFHERNR